MKKLFNLWSDGLFAFFLWGISPIFWKQISDISSFHLVILRILSTLLTISIIIKMQRSSFLKAIQIKRSTYKYLCISSMLIGINWFIYVYAMTHNQVLQGSLGYFMSPVLSFILGIIFYKERLSFSQKIAFASFILAIFILIYGNKEIPWIALTLSSTFAVYGLVKKKLSISSNISLFYENLFLAPLCIVFLIKDYDALGFNALNLKSILFIAFSGLFTYLPLYYFSNAAKKLKLSILGTLQYIAPLGQFLIGYFIYDEEFNFIQLIAYSLVWLGIIVFTTETLLSIKREDENIRN